jgi:hypothetical protein
MCKHNPNYPKRIWDNSVNIDLLWLRAAALGLGLAMAYGLLVGCAGPALGPADIQFPSSTGAGHLPRLAAHTLQADDPSLKLAQAAGFDTVVQVFAWREIEPTRGQYHWEATDQVVAGAEYYGLDLVVRLDQHPAWVNDVEPPLNAPPDALGHYRHFVERVAWRYRGRVRAYIIWNEPNLALEWGGQAPDPAAYVQLLRVGYQGVKAGDPDALVVAAGLAPTNGDGDLAVDERAFLQQMYLAGAAPYFDVLGAHPYGFGLAPNTSLDANHGLVFGRLEALRAIALENGDGHKPVWITEMGWTVDPPPGQPDIGVSLTQQEDYLIGALDRTSREWPWVELVTVWNLSQPDPDDPFGGYSLVDSTGKPRPAYQAWRQAVERRRGARVWEGRGSQGRPQAKVVPILAEDVVVHLGDSDLPSPWWPLFAGRRPSVTWTGGFYLNDPDSSDWVLVLELMQQNEVGAGVAINGTSLSPDLPLGDFARRWLTVRRQVPVSALRPGYNELTVTTARLAPDLQHDEFVWDDFQIRNLRLVASSPR